MATHPTIMKLRLAAINGIISRIARTPELKYLSDWERGEAVGESELAHKIRKELNNLPKGYIRPEPSLKTKAKTLFLLWRENQAKAEWKTLSADEQAHWEGYVEEGIEFGEIRARELERTKPVAPSGERHPVGAHVELLETIRHMGTDFPAGSRGVVICNTYMYGHPYTVQFDDETLGSQQFRFDELGRV